MQEIAFEIDAQRVGRASGYLGGLTIERYTFTGATLPPGTRLAILTRAGVTIASAEIAEGNAATVDTNTQEVADLLRYQPLGACESVYIALGNADNILALIPAVMRKNWLDDEATHPPVPANRYPTKAELDAWLARFDERAAASEAAKVDAQEAAAQAAQRATAAQKAQTAAESAATAAQTAQGKAEAAQAAAEAAQEGAEAAKEAASQSATAASQSAQEAAQGVATLLQGKVDAAEAAKAGAEAAKAAAETAKAGADAAKAAAASSATAAANSASAAAKSATDLADAVATAESLDGRISTIEGYGTQYKRDFRIDTTGLVNPLATSQSASSPFASIYRRTNKGYDGRYFSDCGCHILNDYDSAFIYDASGKYLGRITNTGIGYTVAHKVYQFACLTTYIGDYRYGIFNGCPYNKNKMIISKFKRNADNTDYELVASRVYATRGVEGAIFQWAGWNEATHYVGPVVPSRRTGHILVFGDYCMSVKNDEGTIADNSIGYGYIVFDSDLNFVKWDETAGAFVSSETFDMSYFHAVSGRASNGITAYWAWEESQYLSLVAVQQETNATNGLYYVDPHDNLVPITFSRGPYASEGIDYLPLGGSLLSVDSNALFSTYAPRLVMSGGNTDGEGGKLRVVKIFNGARMFYITMTKTDEEPGCTFTYRQANTINKTQFNGSRISDNKYLFLHGRYTDTYTETQLFLYRNGYIYSSDGEYVRSLTLSTTLAQISPQRGMYARSPHLQFAPCGGYQSATGAVLLDM